MLLAGVRVRGVGPLDDLTFSFAPAPEHEGQALMHRLTVLFGGAGVGKTSLLAALSATRPCHAVALAKRPSESNEVREAPAVVADWILGDDDRARPHPLRITTPNAEIPGEDEAAALQRRREQIAFERRAAEGGYVFVAFSGARWFARSPFAISAPERSLGRYDARSPAFFDDATRADLARETKQVLAYASLGAALARASSDHRMVAFDAAVRGAMAALLEPFGYAYRGSDPLTFEPLFDGGGRGARPFDDLPHGLRHLVSFVALPLRALYAAYPGADPRSGQAVVAIDDVERDLDDATARAVTRGLTAALPRVQWIVTTSSRAVVAGWEESDACDEGQVLALRKLPTSRGVELFAGGQATLH